MICSMQLSGSVEGLAGAEKEFLKRKPSYRSSPEGVPYQRKPCRSCRMQLILVFDSPSLSPSTAKGICSTCDSSGVDKIVSMVSKNNLYVFGISAGRLVCFFL